MHAQSKFEREIFAGQIKLKAAVLEVPEDLETFIFFMT